MKDKEKEDKRKEKLHQECNEKNESQDAERKTGQEAGSEKQKETKTDEDTDNAKSEPVTDKDSADREDPKDTKISELNDKVMRQMAEFDNYRKRTDKEKEQMFETGATRVIEKILPVVDNFERGLEAVKDKKDDPFVDGMEKIYRQMVTELENIGVKPIEAVGCDFNPDFHNAVMQEESDELESGKIAKELQKGYTYRDTVVRHSMVSVVK